MIKDSSWMLAFIADLRDVARKRDLPDLAEDLEAVLTRHRPLLAPGSAPRTATDPAPAPGGNVIPLKGRVRA